MSIYLNEYVKLKDEQITRLRFRDNLLYATLVAFGGIISYMMSELGTSSEQSHYFYYTFLVLPWVCLILGWTYLVNDEKISAIGWYIRGSMTDKLGTLVGQQSEPLLGWEIVHRDDNLRKPRKYFQLIIDELTFVISGAAALYIFWVMWPDPLSLFLWVIMGVEGTLLVLLGVWIFMYSDTEKGR